MQPTNPESPINFSNLTPSELEMAKLYDLQKPAIALKCCKFCGIHLRLLIDLACPFTSLENFLKLAACNPCADFKMACIKITDTVQLTVVKLNRLKREGPEQLKAFLPKATENLTALTKALATATCAFHKIPNQWSDSVVSQLLNCPPKYKTILENFVDSYNPKPRPGLFD